MWLGPSPRCSPRERRKKRAPRAQRGGARCTTPQTARKLGVSEESQRTRGCAPRTRGCAPRTRGCAPRTRGCAPRTRGCAPRTRGCAPRTRGCAPRTRVRRCLAIASANPKNLWRVAVWCRVNGSWTALGALFFLLSLGDNPRVPRALGDSSRARPCDAENAICGEGPCCEVRCGIAIAHSSRTPISSRTGLVARRGYFSLRDICWRTSCAIAWLMFLLLDRTRRSLSRRWGTKRVAKVRGVRGFMTKLMRTW